MSSQNQNLHEFPKLLGMVVVFGAITLIKLISLMSFSMTSFPPKVTIVYISMAVGTIDLMT